MNGPVRLPTLETIAREHGRRAGAVRAAVNKGLIPKAERHGLGKGKGLEWVYPPGTDQSLLSLFKLQAKGYRGGALHFALWWNGRAPFGADIPKYVASVFDLQRKIFQAQSTRPERSSPARDKPHESVEEPGVSNLSTLYDPGVLQVRLNRALTQEALDFVREFLNELDPAAALRPDQMKQLMRVSMATVTKIWPGDVGASAFPFLAAWLTPRHPKNPKKRALADKLTVWLHTPGWFDEFLDHIRSATPEEYETARLLVKDDSDYLHLMGAMASMLKPIVDSIKATSTWQFQHLGPLQHPELAARAATLGYLVSFPRQVRELSTGADDAPGEVSRV